MGPGLRKFLQYLATIVVVPLLLVLLLEFSLGLLGFGYPADFLIRQELQGKPFYKDKYCRSLSIGNTPT